MKAYEGNIGVRLFLEKDVLLKIIQRFFFVCLKVRKVFTNTVMSTVPNQQGQCDGAALPGLLEVAVLPGAEVHY